jgi:hypothetical protein
VAGQLRVSPLSTGAACALFLFLVEKSSKSTSNPYKTPDCLIIFAGIEKDMLLFSLFREVKNAHSSEACPMQYSPDLFYG